MVFALPGYRLGKRLRCISGTAVYEIVRRRDRRALVAYVYTIAPDRITRARFDHEIGELRGLEAPGTAPILDQLQAGDRQVLVVDRFSALELSHLLAGGPPKPRTLLTLAIRMTRILAGLHARRRIHRNLKPSSILVDPETLEVYLTDFGISAVLENAQRQIYEPGALRETLPYLSPEQTGRTGRSVDHRSDLYSLGAIFYELLTGRPPFESSEPLGLIHAHLAHRPVPPHEICRRVPGVLSGIVARLLAKDPVDRYQSASGLLDDLERCRASCGEDGGIEPFTIADTDLPEMLQVPDRLYGRTAELRELVAAFERVARGQVETVLIHGPSGIGKTTLVGELQRPVAGRRGYLVAGKFELHRRDVPFLALRQVLTALAELLLCEDDVRLARWKRRIGDAVGPLVGVLLGLAPKLEGVLGPQPEPVELGALEDRNRLFLAVRRFFRGVAAVEHPVAVFVDDLQWSDPGSLRLLEHLASDETLEALLLITACRDVDPRDAGRWASLRDRLARKRRRVVSLQLRQLSPAAVTELVGDTLRVEARRARELAEALAGRTDNNPLLIRLHLLFLAERGLLVRGVRGWTWEEDAVASAGIPADAAHLVQAKLRELSGPLREVLRAATCAGNRFDLARLGAAMAREPAGLLPQLEELCEKGLLARCEGDGYRFSHDRIEEVAARELRPEKGRVYHERIGRFLLEVTAETDVPDRVHEIVEHLNHCVADATDPQFLLDLARLDHLAGVKALGAMAYATAERHLAAGITSLRRARKHLPPDPQQARLELLLRIDHARSIALCGRSEESAGLFDELLGSFARDPVDIGQICAARVDTLTITGDIEEASRWGLHGLACCGLAIPRRPSRTHYWISLARLRWAFRKDVCGRLAALPECSDPRALMRAELFSRLVVPCYLLGGKFYPVLMGEQARHVLRWGLSPLAYYPLTGAGAVLGSVLGDHGAAEEMVLTALELSHGSGASCRTLMGAYHSVMPWSQPYGDCLAELETAFETGCEEGDVEFAGLTIVACTTMQMVLGRPLAAVSEAARRAEHFRADAGLAGLVNRQQGLARVCEVLMGRQVEPETPGALGLPSRDEARAGCEEALWQIELLVFLHRPERAFELAESIAEVAESSFFATHYLAELVFFHGFAAAACGDEGLSRRRGRALSRARRRLRGWSASCPANFEHKMLLLEAERTRLRGSCERSLQLYEQAADSARRYGVLHLEALILERQGRFARFRGWSELARGPLGRARDLYADWGARRKVEMLEAEFPELAETESGDGKAGSLGLAISPEGLDMMTVLGTSQAISEEIRLDAVIDRIMSAAIENAGAERGVLVLERSGEPAVTAERTVGQATVRFDPGIPIGDATDRLALSALRLASRTGEPILVGDAGRDPRFAADAHVADRGVRSIACLPILHQGRRCGVLYLENNLAQDVFTADRIALLRVISTQAAISLENARLYDELSDARDRLEDEIREQRRVDAIRRELVVKLKASNAEIERVAYTTSHDLKNPLVTIRSYLGKLEQEIEHGLGERLPGTLRVIERAADRMSDLLDGVAEFIRVGRELRPSRGVNLLDLASEALDRHAGYLQERSVKAVVSGSQPNVTVDRAGFLKVFECLVDNAVRFLGPQTEPRVEIKLGQREDRLRIVVADNGMGIAPAYHRKIFDLFEQLDASSPGIGLGLAVVKRIVEAHGGTVEVESDVRGEGSRFVIELPRSGGSDPVASSDSIETRP